jgi:hypothetical protein
MTRTETITAFDGFSSYEDAEAHRSKLMHKDLYGLYCIYGVDKNQVFSVMPLKALNILMEFDESKEAKLREKNT